jgi:hypothetical protein
MGGALVDGEAAAGMEGAAVEAELPSLAAMALTFARADVKSTLGAGAPSWGASEGMLLLFVGFERVRERERKKKTKKKEWKEGKGRQVDEQGQAA